MDHGKVVCFTYTKDGFYPLMKEFEYPVDVERVHLGEVSLVDIFDWNKKLVLQDACPTAQKHL